MMQRTQLIVTEGQTGRLSFNIVAPEGTNCQLEGAVRVAGVDYPMELESDTVLLFGALPVGSHLYEVRVGGCTVLYGRIAVKQSPLAGKASVATWTIDYDSTGPTDVINCYLQEGPQGKQGEPGKQGPEGPRGPQGEPGVLAAAVEAVHEVYARPGSLEGAVSEDWFAVEYSGELEQVVYTAATQAEFLHEVPMYAHIWRDGGEGVELEYLGVSAEAYQQMAGETDTWSFTGVSVQAGDVLRLRFSGSAVPDETTEWVTLGTVMLSEDEAAAAPEGAAVSRGYRVVRYLDAAGLLKQEFERQMADGAVAGALGELMQEKIDAVFNAEVEVALGTPEAGDNSNFHRCELAASRVPVGRVKSLALMCGTNKGGPTLEPFYLALWEQSPDGTEWVFAGASRTTAVFEANSLVRWDFDDDVVSLHGRAVRFCGLLSVPEAPDWEANEVTLRLKVAATVDGASAVWFNASRSAVTPQVLFTYWKAGGAFCRAEHAEDEVLHLSQEEHEGLTALLARKDDLLALLDAQNESAS